jgi:hypothetical protein
LFVVAAAALLWIGYTGRWNRESWLTPEDYTGDPCEIYARVRLAMDDPMEPLLGFSHCARLAAPFGADWSLYPVGDGPTFALAGLLGRWGGPVATVNLLGCALIAGAALSFYLCARRLRWRPEWAAVAALLFAFSNYHLRWLVTLSFVQTWTLPPLLLLCARASRPAPVLRRQRRLLPLAAGLGLWLGLGNPYFVFFAGCVIAGAAALNRLRRAPWRRLGPLALLTTTMAVAVVAGHWGFFAAKLSGSTGADQFDRGYTAAEIYAFKPLDLVVPPEDHRSHLLRDLGRIYASDTALKGEPFYNYLGLGGVAGLGLLAFTALHRAARPAAHRRVPEAALAMLWAGLIATVGGGTAALALFGVDWFRASGRIGVFFSLWALLFLFGALHRVTRTRPRWTTLTLAGLIGVVGWFEQTPWFDHEAARSKSSAQLADDRATVAALERAAGPEALIFQLPFVPFPEAGRTLRLPDYEHFRPFLASDGLRLSYGGLRGQAATNWYAATAQLAAPLMVARLQEAGFSALWIDRRGFLDRDNFRSRLPHFGPPLSGDLQLGPPLSGARRLGPPPFGARRPAADDIAPLLAEFRELGLTEVPTARTDEIVVFLLKPRVPALAPNLEDSRIQPRWNSFTDNPPSDQPWLIDLGGWSPAERVPGRVWRWAQREARIGLDWDGPAREGELSFTVTSAADAPLTIRVDGRELARLDLIGGQRREVRLPCPLKPGTQRLTFEYPGRLRRLGRDSRKIGFMVENLECAPR